MDTFASALAHLACAMHAYNHTAGPKWLGTAEGVVTSSGSMRKSPRLIMLHDANGMQVKKQHALATCQLTKVKAHRCMRFETMQPAFKHMNNQDHEQPGSPRKPTILLRTYTTHAADVPANASIGTYMLYTLYNVKP